MPPPAIRIRPYKDFLTPALHRRFTTAAVTLLVLCYAEAVLIGPWDSWFWSWVPFGRAGTRTGLLFICAFSIFVLRVAQLHVGLRTTNSAFATFRKYSVRSETIQTAGWYLFSAWLYGEVYIFSAGSNANVRWITVPEKNERPRLNERPIYLTSYFLMLAVLQSGMHLYYDYDRVDMPVTKTKPETASDQRAHLIVPPSAQLKTIFPTLITTAVQRAFIMTLVGPVLYTWSIRHFAWSWTLTIAKMLWSLPRSTALPAVAPFAISFLGRTFASGFLLILMWEVGNAAFSAYVAQEPLKNERPITYESRDPNGSLITGLRGKKLQTRAFAFWELVYIAQRFQGRRKILFEEIDRKGGSTWSQILEICLENVNGINTRITEHLNPKPAPAPVPKTEVDPGLPRLTAPLKQDNIFTASPAPRSRGGALVQSVGSIAKSKGPSPSGSPAQKFLDRATAAIIPEPEKTLSPLSAAVRQHVLQFLQSPFGRPFRQEFRRSIAAVVLGSPYGDVGILVDAVDSLTRLCVCSLTEDSYGNVQRDVPNIIRTFTVTVANLEAVKQKLSVHWTDVEKKRESPEVETILSALKGGLQELLAAFGDYSEDLRLSQRDMREAREAATPVAPKGIEPKLVEMKQR